MTGLEVGKELCVNKTGIDEKWGVNEWIGSTRLSYLSVGKGLEKSRRGDILGGNTTGGKGETSKEVEKYIGWFYKDVDIRERERFGELNRTTRTS